MQWFQIDCRATEILFKIHTLGSHPRGSGMGLGICIFFKFLMLSHDWGPSDLVQLLSQSRNPIYVAFSGTSQGLGSSLRFEVSPLFIVGQLLE